jgi:hypothetical protein
MLGITKPFVALIDSTSVGKAGMLAWPKTTYTSPMQLVPSNVADVFVLLVLIKKSPRPSWFISPMPLTKYPIASASFGPGIFRMLVSAASCRSTIALAG